MTCSRKQPAQERWDDPYDYPSFWYADYHEYDRWDRYRRRTAPAQDTGATGSGFSDTGDSFADDAGAGLGGALPSEAAGLGGALQSEGAGLGGALPSEGAGLGGALPSEGAGLGGALDDSGSGLGGSLGADDGWESDFDAS